MTSPPKFSVRRLLLSVILILPSVAHHARAQNEAHGDPADRVFLGSKSRNRPSAPLPTDTHEVIVRLKATVDFESWLARYGMAASARRLAGTGWYLLRPAQGQSARRLATELLGDPNVVGAYVNQRTAFEKFGFTPNDPYFQPNVPAMGWQGQWHLVNQVGGAADANVAPAWQQDLTGSAIVLGIVDDCLQKSHPDLAQNYSTTNSWDFGQNDNDPSPVNSSDRHGTSVAGVAGARGGNGIGVSGAAPFAKLAGLRIDFPAQTSDMFVNATLFRSSAGTESIKVKNHSYGYSSPFIPTPLERQALADSASVETIHVFAAGNERGRRAQDANTLHLQNSPNSITVAALGNDGRFASYSNFGACVFVCAPSSSSGQPGIVTTDLAEGGGYNPQYDSFPDPNYTTQFGGTSSAAPLVTGVLALARQANPRLDTRLAKHLLVRSSRLVDASDATMASGGGWRINGAGFSFNENYGFGCIDAAKLVDLARIYQGTTKLQEVNVGPIAVNAEIPDNSGTGLSRSFSVDSGTPLEEVLLNVNATHTFRGDLEIWLQSPAGTSSRLKSVAIGSNTNASDGGDNIAWTFCSNAFWGESPKGVWTLLVKDLSAEDLGTLDNFTFTARMGVPVLTDNARFVSQTVPTSMVAGQTYAVTVQMMNSGASTWSRPQWYLRSEKPSFNKTWGFSTVSLATTDVIVPGTTKAFSFKVFAPMENGVYNFQWRMMHSSFSGFGEYTEGVPISVAVQPDAARLLTNLNVPATVAAGTSFPVALTMRNVGTNNWTAAAGYALKAITTSTKWSNPFVYLTPEDSISRGADKTFIFSAVAPSVPGKYVMQWQMAKGSTAFGDRTAGKTITVVSP